MDLFHLRVRMTEGHPEVQPSVGIEIEESRSPAAVFVPDAGQTPEAGCIHKRVRTLILVKRLILVDPVGNQDVHQTVVIVVSHGHAHCALAVAEAVHRKPRLIARFAKGAVAIVDIIKVRPGIVDLINVLTSVVVEVSKDYAKASAEIFALANQACRPGDIGKGAITVVVVENALLSFEVIRWAGDRNLLELACIGVRRPRRQTPRIKLREIRYVQVEASIIVVVSKRRAHAPLRKTPTSISNTGGSGNFREGSVAVVSIKPVRAVAGQVDIGESIVVVIADSASTMPARCCHVRL